MELTALGFQLSAFELSAVSFLPHDTLMKSIEHIGTEVAPRVRDMMHG